MPDTPYVTKVLRFSLANSVVPSFHPLSNHSHLILELFFKVTVIYNIKISLMWQDDAVDKLFPSF